MTKSRHKSKLKKLFDKDFGLCYTCERFEDMMYAKLPSDPEPHCPYVDYKLVEGKQLCVNWIKKKQEQD